MQTYLYGLTSQDPLSIAGSVVVLPLGITAAAGFIPAQRATSDAAHTLGMP